MPQERNLDWHRAGAPPLCVLQLGCRLRDAKPVSVAYTLRGDSILLGDIAAIQFSFGDGASQSCRVTDIRVPQ
jgi:hypothetical protein